MQNNEIIKPAKYFSELEKSILLALVEKYKYVLECKKSDARTIALKQRTWQALAHEYNSQPSVSLRDFKQLKKCWENIKARTKKIMAHERREKVKRSASPLLSTHVLGKEKIASMLPEQLYFLQGPPEEEPEYPPDAAAQGTGSPTRRAFSFYCDILTFQSLVLRGFIKKKRKKETFISNLTFPTENLEITSNIQVTRGLSGK